MTRPVVSIRIRNGQRQPVLTRTGQRKLRDAVAVLEALGGPEINAAVAGYLERIRQRHGEAVRIVGRGDGRGRGLPKGDSA